MISKELKSQLSILKETNPEYIQTLKDAVTTSYKAELQAIKSSSTEEEEQLNIEPPYPVIEINRKGLAHFMNEDQGYKSGISMYGHYIACKCLDISSEREYMNQYTDIRILTNEIEPC